MPPDPAQFTFDPEERVFRDQWNRKVSRPRVRESLDIFIDSINADIRNDTQAMVDGTLSIGAWHLKMEGHIKRAHTSAAAIAKGGWKQARGTDWALAGREIKEQYGYLYRFARQLEDGRPANQGTIARAEMYGLSATKTYEGILRRDDLLADFDLERRLLNSQTPCKQCKYYADLGWQTAGTLPDIGEQCACLTRCRCSWERKRSARAQKRRRDSRPKMPKPPKQAKPKPIPKPPVVVPKPIPPTPRPVPIPKDATRKPVAVPEAPKEATRVIPPPEPEKPSSDTPEGRIEAARLRQREANKAWASNRAPGDKYGKVQERFQDLIPPLPIQDRLRRYEVGDEKVKAIAALAPKYEQKAIELDIQRKANNEAFRKLLLEQDKVRAPYKGSSLPVPDKVASKVTDLQNRMEALEKKGNEIRREQNGLEEARRKEAHSFLKVDDPATFNAKKLDNSVPLFKRYTNPTGMAELRVNEALEWLRTNVAKGDASVADITIGVGTDGRAFYHPAADMISIGEHTKTKTIIHEYGHAIDFHFESSGSQVKNVSKEFVEYRTKGEAPRKMNSVTGGGYRDWEEGRKDKFDQVFDGNENSAYYTGHTHGPEVFTMGLQEVWDDPVKVATKDPEWFKFVAGILDGSLR